MKRLLLIRHAESLYNQYLANSLKVNEVFDHNEALVLFTRFHKREELLDPFLSQNGIAQTEVSVKENFDKLNRVKLVITTPMTRTLETTRRLFGGISVPPEIVVIPNFEKSESVSDFPFRTLQNVKKYNNCDFKLLENKLKTFGYAWFIYEFFSPYKKELFLDAIKNVTAPDLDQEIVRKSFEIVDKSLCFALNSVENSFEFYFRILKAKNSISQILTSDKYKLLKDEEVAVVAHWNFLAYLTAASFNENFTPVLFNIFKNCEIKEFDFELNTI